MDEKALEAALNAVVPGGGPVWDYFDGGNITAADAEEIGVKLAIPGRWHWHSEVRGDEFRDTLKTVLGSAITAYLQALSGSTGETEGWVLVPREITPKMAHALESNIAECVPPSEVHAANWRDAYRAMLSAAGER